MSDDSSAHSFSSAHKDSCDITREREKNTHTHTHTHSLQKSFRKPHFILTAEKPPSAQPAVALLVS